MTLDEYNLLVTQGTTSFDVSYVNTYSGLGAHPIFQRGTFTVTGDVLIFPDGSVLLSPMETYDAYYSQAVKVIKGSGTVDLIDAQKIVDAGYVDVLTYSIESYDNGTASTNFTGVEVLEGGLSNTDFTGIELITGGVA